MALSQIHTPATFTQICCFVIIPHWDDMHICDEACFFFFLFKLSWYSENTITTCVHTQNWYWWRMWWKWLVQMHAPSLEAVNRITLFSPSSSSICSHNPFLSPAVILSEEHGRTSTQRGWRDRHRTGDQHRSSFSAASAVNKPALTFCRPLQRWQWSDLHSWSVC